MARLDRPRRTQAPSSGQGRRSTRRTPLLLAAALSLLPTLALAAGPTIRGDVTASQDALTIGDLVDNVPPAVAATPLFRAPALGATGTIQVRRILTAAEALGIGRVETGGRLQVTVTRAARQVGATEIEAAIRARLAKDFGADPTATGIVFDAPSPSILVGPEVAGDVVASDVTLDRRSRRVSASLWIGPSATERRGQTRVTGVLVDLVEVAVAARPLERGHALKAGDVTLERRPRDLVPADVVLDGSPLEGRVARRAVAAGMLLRPADLVRPELVGRGDVVTVVYEMPGMSLSMRAKATEAGAMGDTVGIVNPQSKKTLQAVVIGPGRVSASTAMPGRLAAASH